METRQSNRIERNYGKSKIHRKGGLRSGRHVVQYVLEDIFLLSAHFLQRHLRTLTGCHGHPDAGDTYMGHRFRPHDGHYCRQNTDEMGQIQTLPAVFRRPICHCRHSVVHDTRHSSHLHQMPRLSIGITNRADIF